MKLTSRQKALIPIIILAFMYISWQIYDMFFATGKTATQTVVTTPAATTNKDTTKSKTQLIHPAAPQITAPQKKDVAELAAGKNPARQAAFAKLMHQYQALQSKRMLLQEEMAIAQTQHKIAELGAQLTQLGVTSQSTATSASPHSSGYSLMYIDHQRGQWSAFLNKDGASHRVKARTKLSDGIQVISINSTGVLIEQDGKLTKLTFSGPIHVRKHPIKPLPIAKKSINKKKITLITHHQTIIAKKRITPKFIAPKIRPLKITKKPAATVKAVEKIPPHPVKTRATSSSLPSTSSPLPSTSSPLPSTSSSRMRGSKKTLKPNFSTQTIKKVTPAKTVTKKPLKPNFSTQSVKPVVTTKLKPNFKTVHVVKNKKIASKKTVATKTESTFKTKKTAQKTSNYKIISTRKPTVVRVVHLKSSKKMQANYRVRKLRPHLILTSSKSPAEKPIQLSPYPNPKAGLANAD